MSARKVAQIIDETPALRHIVEASQLTEQLQRVYLQATPAALARSSRIAYASGGILFVAAGNGACAAKLRQLAPGILACFRQHGWEFNSMRIRVQVATDLAPHSKISTNSLSKKALDEINRAATETPPSPLKDALQRLGRLRPTRP